MNRTIFPTHHCFDDAAKFMNAVAEEGDVERLLKLRLVHGIVRFPDDQEDHAGALAAHGWIEDGDTVIEGGLLNGEFVYVQHAREDFYARCRVSSTTVYTALELVQNTKRHGYVGPWRTDLKRLLRTPTAERD